MNNFTRNKGYLALFITSFVWGTTWVVSKIGVGLIHPLMFSGVRQFCGGTLFLLFFVITGKATWPSRREWRSILALSLLLFVLSNGFTVWSMAYLSSGLGSILGAIAPLFVAIINWLTGDKDRPHALSVLGLILGFGGVAVIFSDHLSDFFKWDFRIGIMLALFATFTWACGTVVTTRTTLKLNRYYSLGWQMFISGIIMFSLAHIGGVSIPISSIPPTAWACIVYMVLFGSIIAFGAFIYSITHLPATLASVYAYLNPVVAVTLGYIILKEPLSLSLAIGALITLAGVYLVNKGFKKRMKEMNSLEEEAYAGPVATNGIAPGRPG